MNQDFKPFVNNIVDFYRVTNILHPFREGNGRTQRIFISQLIRHAGYEIKFSKISADDLMSATIKAANGVNDYLKDIFTKVIKVNWIQIHRWSISKVIPFQKIWEWIKKLFLIPVDSYTYIVDHLKLLLCDSLIRPISIGLIFLCGNESTFHLISAEISATPKLPFQK